MYLFFDVETNGKPRNWRAPANDTFNWPRMVQIAWLLYNEDRELMDQKEYTIKPEGFDIPYEMEKIHGINPEVAREKGAVLKDVLLEFNALIDKAEYAIAHNMNLCASVIGAEMYRKSISDRIPTLDAYCTMQESTHFCKLPGKEGRFKWPSLMELHAKLFNARYQRESAINDVSVVALSFFKLVDIEAIDIF